MRKDEKRWEKMRKDEKRWEKMRTDEKRWEKMRKDEKSIENNQWFSYVFMRAHIAHFSLHSQWDDKSAFLCAAAAFVVGTYDSWWHAIKLRIPRHCADLGQTCHYRFLLWIHRSWYRSWYLTIDLYIDLSLSIDDIRLYMIIYYIYCMYIYIYGLILMYTVDP